MEIVIFCTNENGNNDLINWIECPIFIKFAKDQGDGDRYKKTRCIDFFYPSRPAGVTHCNLQFSKSNMNQIPV